MSCRVEREPPTPEEAYRRLCEAVNGEAEFVFVRVMARDLNALLQLVERLGGPSD